MENASRNYFPMRTLIYIRKRQSVDAALLQLHVAAIRALALCSELRAHGFVAGANGASCSEIFALSPTTTIVISSGLMYSAVSFCTSAGVTAFTFCTYVFK